MIRITKNSANTVVITTTEKGSASHYLFQFFNLSTLGYDYCVADDTSAYPERYNTFTITDTSNPTATDAEVDLKEGELKYFVYANSSAVNLDPTGLTLLESGMCVVTGTTTNPTEYSNNEGYTIYEG